MITLPDTHPIIVRHIMSQDTCEQIINQCPEYTGSVKKSFGNGPFIPGQWSESIINKKRIRLEQHTEQWITDLLDIDNIECESKNMYVCMYRKGDVCNLHNDPSKYTILLALNNAYAGGEVIVDQQRISLDTGDCIVFKGDTKHEVKEITDGVRWSLNIWIF